MSAWITSRVSERREWAPGLCTLKLTEPRALAFRPGQFINVALPIDAERVRRSYSLASAPGAPPELYLAEVAGGELTPQLFALQPGDELELDPTPQGFFTLEEVPSWATQLWLVATGTGLGPYVSMWRSSELARFERVVIVHGVRMHDQLGYAAELAELCARDPRFRAVRVVSREAASPGVLDGRITTAFEDGRLERAAGTPLDVERCHVMLCGNPAMIKETSALLEGRGLRKNRRRDPGHLSAEKYW